MVLRLALVALALFALAPSTAAGSDPGPATAKVVSVYDGDTFTLSNGDKVRLRLVNTPELKPPEHYAVEAREATAALVLEQEVSLTYGADTRDAYGRLLANAKVGETDLATHLLELGLAHLFVIPPESSDPAPLLAAQEQARQGGRGIWGDEEYKGDLHITSFHANSDGDDRKNVNGEYLRVCNVSTHPVDLQGFRIADLAGRSWTFPALIVPPGHTFKVHSGKGANQSDPSVQLELYLGSADPIWNNERDRATIYDRYGHVVDSRLHDVADKKGAH